MRWFSIIALLLASCGPRPESVHSREPTSTQTEPARHEVAEQQIVGTVVMIACDCKVVYARAAGLADREANQPVRENTLFRLASMTKPIVMVTALALIDQGKLALTDPVTKWLPDFKPKLADGRTPTIAVRHL